MINEIIAQIGGRVRLEQMSQCSDVTKLFAYEMRHMARALLAVMDAQEELVASYANGAHYCVLPVTQAAGRFVKCGDTWYETDAEDGTKLYTEAPPSVLPPELTMDDAPCHYGSNEACAWVSGANSMRELFSSPGAQPQKPVVLPMPSMSVVQGGKGVMVPAPDGHWLNKTAVLEAIDAANVKWEVKK